MHLKFEHLPRSTLKSYLSGSIFSIFVGGSGGHAIFAVCSSDGASSTTVEGLTWPTETSGGVAVKNILEWR